MLKKLPVKNEYLLLIAAVILLLICYQLAFKATFSAWQTNRQLTAELARSNDLSYQPGYLERKSGNLSKIISLYRADTVAFRNNSISTISAIAEKEKVKLSEVPVDDPFYHTEKFIIQKLNFEGDFFALTRVLNQLQKTEKIGIIRSLSYKTTSIKTSLNDEKKLVLEVDLEIAK